jgi:hypothetical protein
MILDLQAGLMSTGNINCPSITDCFVVGFWLSVALKGEKSRFMTLLMLTVFFLSVQYLRSGKESMGYI